MSESPDRYFGGGDGITLENHPEGEKRSPTGNRRRGTLDIRLGHGREGRQAGGGESAGVEQAAAVVLGVARGEQTRTEPTA